MMADGAQHTCLSTFSYSDVRLSGCFRMPGPCRWIGSNSYATESMHCEIKQTSSRKPADRNLLQKHREKATGLWPCICLLKNQHEVCWCRHGEPSRCIARRCTGRCSEGHQP